MTPSDTLREAAARHGWATEDWLDRVAQHATIDAAGHWLWDVLDTHGYGKTTWQDVTVGAHRWLWQLVHGALPSEVQVDHLCRVRACCNPEHLEAVTAKVNKRRALAASGVYDACRKGHPREMVATPENGVKVTCRQCRNEQARARRQKLTGTTPPEHGTSYAYLTYGCRCETCRTAASERRATKKALAVAAVVLGQPGDGEKR